MRNRTINKIAISTGSLPRLEGKQFYELSSVIRVMERLLRESEIDGFEFALLPEWDSENAPLTPSDAPKDCEKHSVKEVLAALRNQSFPILSVHANRDVGNYLCSEDSAMVRKGMRLMIECLDFARKMDSRVCVFHFWDTWKEAFDLNRLLEIYKKYQEKYADVELSIENIPTKYKGKTPFQIANSFRHVTLDFKWASLFNEFDSFTEAFEHVDNVHIQGKMEGGRLVPTAGCLDYERALEQVVELGYSGVFTVELEGRSNYADVLNYISKLKNE